MLILVTVPLVALVVNHIQVFAVIVPLAIVESIPVVVLVTTFELTFVVVTAALFAPLEIL